jgi:hypothetical protein
MESFFSVEGNESLKKNLLANNSLLKHNDSSIVESSNEFNGSSAY